MHDCLSRNRRAIAEICRRRGVVRLDVFGSAARGTDFDPEHSDADFLVEFENGYGVDHYFGLKGDLEGLLARPVDLITRNALDCGPRGRLDEHIAKEAMLVYEQ